MVMGSVGLGRKNHCAGEGQQQFSNQSVNEFAVRDSPAGKDVNMKAEDSTFLGVVT
jgi:hypothetical protein